MRIDNQPNKRTLTYDDVYCQVTTALAEDFGKLVPGLSRKHGMDVDRLVGATAAAAIHSGIYWQMAHLGVPEEAVTRVIQRVSEVICQAIKEHDETSRQE